MARLTRDVWVDAAYVRFTTGGLGAVVVEPIARDLGATKGSFYWHFADRAALVAAVLERWERLETDQVIELAEQAHEPQERLARLIEVIAHRTQERSGERTLYAEASAYGAADVVSRITERRVAYVTALLQELRLDPGEARRRAITLVAAVIGYQQLVWTGWDPGAEPPALVATLFETTLGDCATPAVE